jgi:hypothetical protein
LLTLTLAESGFFNGREKGWAGGEECHMRISQSFPREYAAPPKLLFGLSHIDIGANRNRALAWAYPEVQNSGFSLQAMVWAGAWGHDIGCSWMTLPSDLHLETGLVDTYSQNVGDFDVLRRQIFFSQSFVTPPRVCVWLQAFEWHGGDFMSLKCSAADITSNSFTIQCQSWANRRFKNVRIQYLAYPSEEDGKRVKSGTSLVNRAQGHVEQNLPFYGSPFKEKPQVFIAICETDFNISRNSRFRTTAEAEKGSLKWSYGTWADTDMDHAGVQWIALE